MFFPEKNVRRQFWMVIVAMFLAVLGKDVFVAIIHLIQKEVQPHVGILISIIAFLTLILVFLVLYLVGLPLLYFGEKYIVRGHKEHEEVAIKGSIEKKGSKEDNIMESNKITGITAFKNDLEFLNAVAPLVIFSTLSILLANQAEGYIIVKLFLSSGILFIGTILYVYVDYITKEGDKVLWMNRDWFIKLGRRGLLSSFIFLFFGLILFLVSGT